MTTYEHIPYKSNRPKLLNYHLLFKKSLSNQKVYHDKLQIGRQDPVFNCSPQVKYLSQKSIDIDEKALPMNEKSLSKGKLLNRGNNNSHKRRVIIYCDQRIQVMQKRAYSSAQQFHTLMRETSKKKTKKFCKNLFQYAKLTKRESTSKKSTDQSTYDHAEHLRVQNEEFKKKIRDQQGRVKKIEKQILDEIKRHQIQRQLYGKSIQILKRVAGQGKIFEAEEQNEVEDSDSQYLIDNLSIQSS